MAIDKQALTYLRGDSYDKVVTIRDKATKVPIDLTGAALVLTVDTLQDPPDDTTKVFEVALVIAADQVADKGKATFRPSVANNAVVGNYFYDIQMTGADGSVRTVAKSTYTIPMDITK